MPSWSDVEAEIPELAALARCFLDAQIHKTLATLRYDGSPRISGIEVNFADGELWLGGMWRGVEAADPRRGPRLAGARGGVGGAPRSGGMEGNAADGELWLGSMWRALKALDLRRDPRFALHSGSADPPDWTGDAKLAGRIEEVTDTEQQAD